jgi:hypothetical protein
LQTSGTKPDHLYGPNVMKSDLEDTTTIAASSTSSEMDKLESQPGIEVEVAHDLHAMTIDTNTIAGDLFANNVKCLSVLVGTYSVHERARFSADDLGRIRNNLERLVLWRDGLELSNDSLDTGLSQSTELQSSAVTILFQMGKIIYTLLMLAHLDYRGTALPIQQDEVHKFLKGVSRVMESDAQPTEMDSGWPHNHDLEVAEILTDLDTYIDCLMDLSLAFEGSSIIKDPPQLDDVYIEEGATNIATEDDASVSVNPPKLPKLAVRSSTGDVGPSETLRLQREEEPAGRPKGRTVELPKEPARPWMPPLVEEESDPSLSRD